MSPTPEWTPQAPAVAKHTEAYRLEVREQSKESLFFTCKHVLGMADLSEELHWDMARFLEGKPPFEPWLYAVMAIFRGALKSSVGTIGLSIWTGIWLPDHATRIVEQKAESAKDNHYDKIRFLFEHSRRADFLQWLYQEEMPKGTSEWNDDGITFYPGGERDPFAAPSITYGGLGSKQEGYHGNLIIGDDLEGADAAKSDVPNAEAYRFVTQRAKPLLKDLSRDRILIIGTPHGIDPLVHRLRDEEEKAREEGLPPVWEVFWQPVLRADGKSAWPERFTPKVIGALQRDTELWEEQYMLRRKSTALKTFNRELVERFAYRLESGGRMIRYPRPVWDLDHLDEFGNYSMGVEWVSIAPWALWYFIHGDPKHRDQIDIKSHRGNADAAIIVTAVAPDGHAFVVETWAEQVGLELFADAMYRLYMKWAPRAVTLEGVGAQHWFWDYSKLLEETKYRVMTRVNPFTRKREVLPGLRSRLIEARKSTRTEKDDHIVQQLQSWVHSGSIHVDIDAHQELIAQMDSFPTPGKRDLLDCLAQGPQVWDRPPSPEATARRMKAEAQRLLAGKTANSDGLPTANYRSPFMP